MKTNYLKLGVLGLMMMVGTTINAQTTDQTDAKLVKKTAAAADAVVRVIDNKGTIKYLQSSNGITTITSTTSGSATTTTWQLGGTLTDNTYIDVDEKVFALDGIDLVDTSVLAASTNAISGSDHGTGSGFTILVRDEDTGATKKLKLEDLLTSAYTEKEVDAAFVTAKTITFAGLTSLPTSPEKIWVYRNGAKLRSGKDYTIATNVVTLVPGNSGNQAPPNDWTLYEGDIIEVQVLSF